MPFYKKIMKNTNFILQHKMKPSWRTNGDFNSCQLVCEFIPHFDREIKE